MNGNWKKIQLSFLCRKQGQSVYIVQQLFIYFKKKCISSLPKSDISYSTKQFRKTDMNFLFVSIKKLLALDGGPAVSERIIKLSDGSKE